MSNRITVWGDSVLKGVVVSDTGRYERLGEKGCIPSLSKTIGIPIDNRAKFGMTSEKGLELFAKQLDSSEPGELAVICFGGNDVDHDWNAIAAHPELIHEPHVSLERFSQNLCAMGAAASEHGVTPILVTIPPISAERYFRWFSGGGDKSRAILRWLGDIGHIYRMQELYNDAVIKAAKALPCRLIDIRQAFLLKRNMLDTLCVDGIHPNEAGHRLMEQVFLDFAHENKII